AVAGTPIAGSASEASAQSVPAETPVARVATEEPEPPPSQARERPLVVLGLAVFLAVVTVAGVVFGFILPALYRSGRRAARR
ncbi:MAG: hypothetical protein NZL87_09040, partial [Thermomicrobium sp.]|nr:hypothetical protein [Thermomicrobium sp.]